MSFWSKYALPFTPPPVLPVLSVGNLKGGVGKTAIVAYLTLVLADKGFRVLAIDLDFQGSLTTLLSHIRLRPEYTGVTDFLLGDNSDVLYDYQIISPSLPAWKNITLVGADFRLADDEDALFAQLVTGTGKRDPRTLLANKLAEATLQKDYDVVILDTPPRLTIASINALGACTHVLIPTTPTRISMNGSHSFIKLLERMRPHICPKARLMAVLPTMGVHHQLPPNLGRSFTNIEFWEELHIPRRQAIADNAPLTNHNIQTFFPPLANKVIQAMGIVRGTSHASPGINAGVGPNGTSVSQ